jgi:hypothetical protein
VPDAISVADVVKLPVPLTFVCDQIQPSFLSVVVPLAFVIVLVMSTNVTP